MNATINQAKANEKNLTIKPLGNGQFKVSCTHYGQRISATTTDTKSIDYFNSEFDEVDKSGRNKRRLGYVKLCREIIEKNKTFVF